MPVVHYGVDGGKDLWVFYDGNEDEITESINDLRNTNEVNIVIQNNEHIHYILEYYDFCHTAYIYNGNSIELLCYEHPSYDPFFIEEDHNRIRIYNGNDNWYRTFDLDNWEWIE